MYLASSRIPHSSQIMFSSKTVVASMGIFLVQLWLTQAGCIHLKSKLDKFAVSKSPAFSKIQYYPTEAFNSENTCPRKAEYPRKAPSYQSPNPEDDDEYPTRNSSEADIDFSITICSSASSEDSDSRSVRSPDESSYESDSFELILPSFKTLSKKKTPLRSRSPVATSRSTYKTPPAHSKRVSSRKSSASERTSKSSGPRPSYSTYASSSEGYAEKMHYSQPYPASQQRAYPPSPPSQPQPHYVPEPQISSNKPHHGPPEPPPQPPQFYSPNLQSPHTPSSYQSPQFQNHPPAMFSTDLRFPHDLEPESFAARPVNEPMPSLSPLPRLQPAF